VIIGISLSVAKQAGSVAQFNDVGCTPNDNDLEDITASLGDQPTVMFDITAGVGEPTMIGKPHHYHFTSAGSVFGSDRGSE
jgi:hypothetical protein